MLEAIIVQLICFSLMSVVCQTFPLQNQTEAIGIKQKVTETSTGLLDGSFLPGFGRSSNSCITISSGKDIEDDASMNCSPSISLDLSIRNPALMNTPCASIVTLESKRSKLDLEINLSTGLSESTFTCVPRESVLFQDSVSGPLTDDAFVADGSTSMRKLGYLVHPLHSTEDATALGLVASHDSSSPVISVFSSPVTASHKSSFSCASGMSPLKQRRHTSVKTCQFSGCMKGSRGASGFCIGHGCGRRCQRAGCNKGAEGKTVFCKAHGGGRRCQFLGCSKSAEGQTDYCIGHGGGRRCSHDGCPRAARGKSGLCIRHGGGKRCKMENCTRSAEGISGLCISHGVGCCCQHLDCTKGAQGSTMFCKAHGGGKRCAFFGVYEKCRREHTVLQRPWWGKKMQFSRWVHQECARGYSILC